MSAWCSWAQKWECAHSVGMCLGILQECKEIKMRKAIFLAALMYSSAAVFGMQDGNGKRSFSNEFAEPVSKVRLIKVNEESPKSMDSQMIKGNLASALQLLKYAQKDVKDFRCLYENALGMIESINEREEILSRKFGEEVASRQISQDKERASRNVEDYFALLQDAKNREENAKNQVDLLSQIFNRLKISNKGTDKSEGSASSSLGDMSAVANQATTSKSLPQTMESNHNNGSSKTSSDNTNKEINLTNLYEYCQRKGSKVALADLNFEYPIENQLFNCKIIIKNKYINKVFYDASYFSKSKKEAKNKIAAVVLEYLLKNKELNTSNGEDETEKNYIVKLNDFLMEDNHLGLGLSDVIFEYEINKINGRYRCQINIPRLNRIYSIRQDYKTKKQAKEAICAYVYGIFITNQQSVQLAEKA